MKIHPIVLVILAFAAGAGVVTILKKENPPPRTAPKADVAALRTQLDQAAERSLPTPTLELPVLPQPSPAATPE